MTTKVRLLSEYLYQVPLNRCRGTYKHRIAPTLRISNGSLSHGVGESNSHQFKDRVAQLLTDKLAQVIVRTRKGAFNIRACGLLVFHFWRGAIGPSFSQVSRADFAPLSRYGIRLRLTHLLKNTLTSPRVASLHALVKRSSRSGNVTYEHEVCNTSLSSLLTIPMQMAAAPNGMNAEFPIPGHNDNSASTSSLLNYSK